jgi:hypothetical protein
VPTRAGGSVEDHDGAADDVAAPKSFECVVNVVQPDGNDVMLAGVTLPVDAGFNAK